MLQRRSKYVTRDEVLNNFHLARSVSLSDIINVVYSIWFLHTEVHDVHIFFFVRSSWLRVADPSTASKLQSCLQQAAWKLLGCNFFLYGFTHSDTFALAHCEFHLLQAHRLHRVRTPSGNANPRTEYVVVDRFSMNLSSFCKIGFSVFRVLRGLGRQPIFLHLNQPINQWVLGCLFSNCWLMCEY